MTEFLKMIFEKFYISKTTLYVIICVFYIALHDCPYNQKVSSEIIKKLFGSYEMFSFINTWMSYLIIVLWTITFMKLSIYIFTNNKNEEIYTERKIQYNKIESVTVYASAFKLFTYFLYNYDKNFDCVILELFIVFGLISSFVIIIFLLYKYIEHQRDK